MGVLVDGKESASKVRVVIPEVGKGFGLQLGFGHSLAWVMGCKVEPLSGICKKMSGICKEALSGICKEAQGSIFKYFHFCSINLCVQYTLRQGMRLDCQTL